MYYKIKQYIKTEKLDKSNLYITYGIKLFYIPPELINIILSFLPNRNKLLFCRLFYFETIYEYYIKYGKFELNLPLKSYYDLCNRCCRKSTKNIYIYSFCYRTPHDTIPYDKYSNLVIDLLKYYCDLIFELYNSEHFYKNELIYKSMKHIRIKLNIYVIIKKNKKLLLYNLEKCNFYRDFCEKIYRKKYKKDINEFKLNYLGKMYGLRIFEIKFVK